MNNKHLIVLYESKQAGGEEGEEDERRDREEGRREREEERGEGERGGEEGERRRGGRRDPGSHGSDPSRTGAQSSVWSGPLRLGGSPAHLKRSSKPVLSGLPSPCQQVDLSSAL